MVPASRSHALRLFAIAWAIAVWFDFGSIHRWDKAIYEVLLVAFAFATVFRAGATLPLLFLAGLQVFSAAGRSPVVSNHYLFMAFVNVGLLTAYTVLALRRRSAQVDAGELYELFAPVGRISLLLLYFYVVFHKLNPDFLDPDLSSGALFWTAQAEILPYLPTDRVGVLIGLYTTIIAEAAIPLLLIFRRTRWWGLVVGLVFHGMVGLSPLGRFWDFSSPIYAMYVLFMPETAWCTWSRILQQARQRTWWRRWNDLRPLVRPVLLVTVLLVFLAYVTSPAGEHLNRAPFRLVWMIYAPAFALFMLVPRASSEEPALAGGFRLPHALLWLGPALVFLNGLNPYLGLKTESSFAMFSNLQTENGHSNHYLMPASLQVFPFQRQCIEILETSNPRLEEMQAEGRLVTLFELRTIAQRYPGGFARIRYEGREFAFDPFRTDQGLLRRPHPLLARYLRFRPIYADGRSGNWH